jgi:putative membrane protein
MHRQAEALKGIAAGALAGLVGGLVMNQFQYLWSKFAADESDSKKAQPPPQNASPQPPEDEQQSQEEEEPATVKAAAALARQVFHHQLTKDERHIADPVVHYTFSATTGMVYGALAEVTPVATIGFGMPFGAAVWAIADEMMVLLFGLSKPPTEYPLSKHLYALASHLVYGATTEATRRLVRGIM